MNNQGNILTSIEKERCPYPSKRVYKEIMELGREHLPAVSEKQIIHKFGGHYKLIEYAKLFPEHNKLITGSTDGLFFWDLKSGKFLNSFLDINKMFSSVVISKDGRKAYITFGNEIRIKDILTGELLSLLKGSTPDEISNYEYYIRLFPTKISSRNALISYSIVDSKREKKTKLLIKKWDLESGSLMGKPVNYSDLYYITRTTNGIRIVNVEDSSSIFILDALTGNIIKHITSNSMVSSIFLSNDERLLILISKDKKMEVRELSTFKLISFHDIGIYFKESINDESILERYSLNWNLKFSPDGRHFFTRIGTIINVWDTISGEMIYSFRKHEYDPYCLVVSPDGKTAVSGSVGEIFVWDIKTGQILNTLNTYIHTISDLKVSSDQKRLVVGSLNSKIRVMNLENGHLLDTLKDHTAGINTITLNADGSKLFSAANYHNGHYSKEDPFIRVWDLKTGKLYDIWHQYINSPESCPEQLISGSGGNKVFTIGPGIAIYDSKNGKLIDYLGSKYKKAAINKKANKLAAIKYTDGREIEIWDIINGKRISVYDDLQYQSVVFTPDGERIICSSRNKIKIWNIYSRECEKVIDTQEMIDKVVCSKDGAKIVSVFHDNTIGVWDRESGRLLNRLPGHDRSIKSILITPDNKKIITGSLDKKIKFWDLETTRLLGICYNLINGVLWTTPPDKYTTEGYFWTDCPEIVSLFEIDKKTEQVKRMLEETEQEYKEFMAIHNNQQLVMTRINDYQEYIRLQEERKHKKDNLELYSLYKRELKLISKI